ncbi:MAG: hypothetical protein WCG93_05355 [Paludibacter sp.]
MNWRDIKVSEDNTHFLFDGKQVFDRQFLEVLKFHSPGLAPVKDESGSYHIDALGNQLYTDRFNRAFGFYFNRAAVVSNDSWFHIDKHGKRTYSNDYSWVGNFQEKLCSVRSLDNLYFHIDLNGNRIYSETYIYCGDFKDGYASVKCLDGFFRHIDCNGKYLNDNAFDDLGVFHKNYATAKDVNGWFHIDKNGNEIYSQRYLAVEPFYNGFSLVTLFDGNKIIIYENGEIRMRL